MSGLPSLCSDGSFRPVPLHLAPHNSADRARTLRTEHQQLCSAKRAHRIRRKLNRCQSLLLALVTNGRISPRRAAVLSYITNQLIHSPRHRA